MTMQTDISTSHAPDPKTRCLDGYIPTTFATGAGLATFIYFLLPNGGISQELLYDLVGISTVAAMILGILWNAPPHPRPWWLLAAGTTLLILGDIAYSVYVVAVEVPHSPVSRTGFTLLAPYCSSSLCSSS